MTVELTVKCNRYWLVLTGEITIGISIFTQQVLLGTFEARTDDPAGCIIEQGHCLAANKTNFGSIGIHFAVVMVGGRIAPRVETGVGPVFIVTIADIVAGMGYD